jgi:hypothetical protein
VVETKKKAKTPKEEVVRAWRIYKEDQSQTRLTIMGKKER